jgi:hypothetical protein
MAIVLMGKGEGKGRSAKLGAGTLPSALLRRLYFNNERNCAQLDSVDESSKSCFMGTGAS